MAPRLRTRMRPRLEDAALFGYDDGDAEQDPTRGSTSPLSPSSPSSLPISAALGGHQYSSSASLPLALRTADAAEHDLHPTNGFSTLRYFARWFSRPPQGSPAPLALAQLLEPSEVDEDTGDTIVVGGKNGPKTKRMDVIGGERQGVARRHRSMITLLIGLVGALYMCIGPVIIFLVGPSTWSFLNNTTTEHVIHSTVVTHSQQGLALFEEVADLIDAWVSIPEVLFGIPQPTADAFHHDSTSTASSQGSEDGKHESGETPVPPEYRMYQDVNHIIGDVCGIMKFHHSWEMKRGGNHGRVTSAAAPSSLDTDTDRHKEYEQLVMLCDFADSSTEMAASSWVDASVMAETRGASISLTLGRVRRWLEERGSFLGWEEEEERLYFQSNDFEDIVHGAQVEHENDDENEEKESEHDCTPRALLRNRARRVTEVLTAMSGVMNVSVAQEMNISLTLNHVASRNDGSEEACQTYIPDMVLSTLHDYDILTHEKFRFLAKDCRYLQQCSGVNVDFAGQMPDDTRHDRVEHPACRLLQAGAESVQDSVSMPTFSIRNQHHLERWFDDMEQSSWKNETKLLALMRHTATSVAAVDQLLVIGRGLVDSGVKIHLQSSNSDPRDTVIQDEELRKLEEGKLGCDAQHNFLALEALVSLRGNLVAFESVAKRMIFRVRDVCSRTDAFAARVNKLSAGDGWTDADISVRYSDPDQASGTATAIHIVHKVLPPPSAEADRVAELRKTVDQRVSNMRLFSEEREVPLRAGPKNTTTTGGLWAKMLGYGRNNHGAIIGADPDTPRVGCYVFWWRQGRVRRQSIEQKIDGIHYEIPGVQAQIDNLRAILGLLDENQAFLDQAKLSSSSEGAEKDYHAILGVSQDATESEIRAAAKALLKSWHPDKQQPKGVSKEEAATKFAEVREAWKALGGQY